MYRCLGFRVSGLGFRVDGLGFRAEGLGFRAHDRPSMDMLMDTGPGYLAYLGGPDELHAGYSGLCPQHFWPWVYCPHPRPSPLVSFFSLLYLFELNNGGRPARTLDGPQDEGLAAGRQQCVDGARCGFRASPPTWAKSRCHVQPSLRESNGQGYFHVSGASSPVRCF